MKPNQNCFNVTYSYFSAFTWTCLKPLKLHARFHETATVDNGYESCSENSIFNDIFKKITLCCVNDNSCELCELLQLSLAVCYDIENVHVFVSYWWLHWRIEIHCGKWRCLNGQVCLFAPRTWWIISSVQCCLLLSMIFMVCIDVSFARIFLIVHLGTRMNGVWLFHPYAGLTRPGWFASWLVCPWVFWP